MRSRPYGVETQGLVRLNSSLMVPQGGGLQWSSSAPCPENKSAHHLRGVKMGTILTLDFWWNRYSDLTYASYIFNEPSHHAKTLSTVRALSYRLPRGYRDPAIGPSSA